MIPSRQQDAIGYFSKADSEDLISAQGIKVDSLQVHNEGVYDAICEELPSWLPDLQVRFSRASRMKTFLGLVPALRVIKVRWIRNND